MSTTAIVLIVIAAIVVVALIALASRRGRERKLERRREHAGELRETARTHGLRAERAQAEADEKAALARRESAAAQERADIAAQQAELARDHHERADELDPDVVADDDGDGRRDDREAPAEAERRAV
jgi:hypothetical protein